MKVALSFAMLAFLMLAGCTSLKPGCIIQDKLSALSTDVVASKLQCANKFAVKADMDKIVAGIGMCKTGPIADAVCPMLVGTVVDKLASTAIPAEWQCTATDAKALVKGALSDACKLIPVSQYTSP